MLNPRSNTVRHYAYSPKPGGLPAKLIRMLYLDSKGQIWVSAGRYLWQYDAQNDRFLRRNGTGSDSLLAPHKVYGMQERPDGTFFLATTRGLYRYNPEGDSYQALADLGTRFGPALYYDPQRRWLFATKYVRSLTCYEEVGDQLRVRYSILPSLGILSIPPDVDSNRLWVATSRGLYLIHIPDGSVIRHWHLKDGLPHQVVYSALPDARGNRFSRNSRTCHRVPIGSFCGRLIRTATGPD